VALDDDITAALSEIIDTEWKTFKPRDVPESTDVALSNGAASVEATYVYADLANSSKLAQSVSPEVTARVIRMYLNMTVRVLRHKGGHIRSFDGDRVMAIFMGDAKNTNAFRAALAVNFYVEKRLPSLIDDAWPAVRRAGWVIKHGVGIDTGDALLVRGGVRNNNDLVSIGSAPNVAAKLSDIRDDHPIHITARSANRVRSDVRTHADGRQRFKSCGTKSIGGTALEVMSSSWWWSL
jgi:adenylate cyclase